MNMLRKIILAFLVLGVSCNINLSAVGRMIVISDSTEKEKYELNSSDYSFLNEPQYYQEVIDGLLKVYDTSKQLVVYSIVPLKLLPLNAEEEYSSDEEKFDFENILDMPTTPEAPEWEPFTP